VQKCLKFSEEYKNCEWKEFFDTFNSRDPADNRFLIFWFLCLTFVIAF